VVLLGGLPGALAYIAIAHVEALTAAAASGLSYVRRETVNNQLIVQTNDEQENLRGSQISSDAEDIEQAVGRVGSYLDQEIRKLRSETEVKLDRLCY